MKYMIMMFGEAATMMETKSPEWIKEMIEFMTQIARTSRRPVNWSSSRARDGSTAKTVSFTNGAPVATDGPFAETNATTERPGRLGRGASDGVLALLRAIPTAKASPRGRQVRRG